MKKIRFFKNLTLDDLYLKTGISLSKLSRVERGIFKPSKEEKILIAKALREAVSKVFPSEDN